MTLWLTASGVTIYDDVLTFSALLGLRVFLAVVAAVAFVHAPVVLFFDSHGWRHRLAGGSQLVCLVVGSCLTGLEGSSPSAVYLTYDFVLGVLGLTATLTAARDFPHKYVQNARGQSGTLSVKAMVTQGEMMEHAFYQFLNLWQALYLHFNSSSHHGAFLRGLGLVLVTAPWLVRRRFPVNSFSSNWIKTPESNRSRTETWMYRIKKSQYLFYKHVILHGLNISIFLRPRLDHASTLQWRVFWLCLNTSYVMEFFLQSLVRRRVLSQAVMLALNRWLMCVSSLAAINAVLWIVRWDLCALSLVLNLMHRYHDLANTLLIAAVAFVLDGYSLVQNV